MKSWARFDYALSSAVFSAVAVGAISAVLLDNAPLGAVLGIVAAAVAFAGVSRVLKKKRVS